MSPKFLVKETNVSPRNICLDTTQLLPSGLMYLHNPITVHMSYEKRYKCFCPFCICLKLLHVPFCSGTDTGFLLITYVIRSYKIHDTNIRMAKKLAKTDAHGIY